jgi:hypothetical protein
MTMLARAHRGERGRQRERRKRRLDRAHTRRAGRCGGAFERRRTRAHLRASRGYAGWPSAAEQAGRAIEQEARIGQRHRHSNGTPADW